MSDYELKIEQFSGPIEKLLELIEEKKLNITEISLSEVTEDFLGYMRKIADLDLAGKPSPGTLRLLADFIAVASRLIFLKSKSLLPGEKTDEDEEGELKDLEYRLRLYSELKPAIKEVASIWKKAKPQYSRPYFMAHQFSSLAGAENGVVFYPGGNVNLEGLAEALNNLVAAFKDVEIDAQTIMEKVVTLEEKIKEIITKLTETANSSLKSLSLSKTRSEIIVIFLAILHLAREQLVHLEQESNFSDIMITKGRL